MFSDIQVYMAGENKSTQCSLPRFNTEEKATQYDLPSLDKPTLDTSEPVPSAIQIKEGLDSESEVEDDRDSSEWLPASDDEVEEENGDYIKDRCEQRLPKERKFMVFQSCLLQLFTVCNVCLSPTTIDDPVTKGSMVTITTTCVHGHVYQWKSQPEHNQMPWGNFLITAACFFSGMQPSKMLTFSNISI